MGPIKNLVHDSDRESMDSERKQNQPKHQNKSDLLRFLAESSILSFLKSDADRNKILKKATIRKLADGECVCREGDDAERILIPLKGSSLDLFTGDLRKEPVHSGSVSEGRVVNFYSVIRHLPFQFTAVRDIQQIVFRFAQQIGIIPVTGTRTGSHMQADLEARTIRLKPAEIRALENIAFLR